MCLTTVTAVALVLRLIVLVQLADSPLIEVPVGASLAYAADGLQAADGAPGAVVNTPTSFLYRSFVSAADHIDGPWLARATQAALGALTCGLVAWLGLALAGRAVGWCAGLLSAAYGPALLYGAELTPAAWAAAASVACLVLLLRAHRDQGGVPGWAAAGAAAGIAALAEPRLLLFVPAAVLWCLRSGGPRLGPSLAFAASALAMAVAGGWTLAGLRAPGLAEAGARLHLAWQGAEVLPDLDPYGPGFGSWILNLLLFDVSRGWIGLAVPFGLVAPLALAGLLLRAGRFAAADGALLAFALAGFAGALLAEPSARGRLSQCLALLPWAAVALVEGPKRLRTVPARGAALAALAVTALAGSAGAEPVRASHHGWLGYAYERLGNPGHAIAAYDAALAAGEAEPDAYRRLARLYASEGMMQRSVEVAQQLAQRRPADAAARVGLGDRLMGAGRAREAETAYRQAVELGAGLVHVGGRLGDALAAQGNPQAAGAAYGAVLEARPDSHRVRFQLARLLEADGDLDGASAHYRQLVQIPVWELRAGVPLALIDAGDESRRPQTESLLRRLLATEPALQPALWTLARLLHDEGRYEEALEPLVRMRQLDEHDPAPRRLLASAYAHLGREAEAGQAYAAYQRLERLQAVQRQATDRATQWAQKVAGR